MSTIKVEHIDWDYGADSSTTTITSIGNLSDGFFRNTVQRRMTAGPTGSTGNCNLRMLYPVVRRLQEPLLLLDTGSSGQHLDRQTTW
jgi:hypothetical protein